MEFLASYIVVLVVFTAIDLVWIKMVMRPIFERNIGSMMRPNPHFGAALAFFVLYQAGLIYFAVLPAVEFASWTLATLHGALLGVIAYGTYEMTSLSILKGWTLQMAIVDVAWGATLSALAATIGYFVWTAIA